jgi:hypothetical protein
VRKIAQFISFGLILLLVSSVFASDPSERTVTPQSSFPFSPRVETNPSVAEYEYDAALTDIGIRAPRDACLQPGDDLTIWTRIYNAGTEMVDSAYVLFAVDSVPFDSLSIPLLPPGGSLKLSSTTGAPPAWEDFTINSYLHWRLDENPDNNQIEDTFRTAQGADSCLVHDDGFADSWSWLAGYEYPHYAMAAKYTMPYDGVIKYWKWYYNQILCYPTGNVELFVWEADTAGFPLDWGFGGLYDMEFEVPLVEFPDYAYICYPMSLPVRERESYFFGYSNRLGTIQYFCIDDQRDEPLWNWWKADGVWYPDNLYDGDFMAHVCLDPAGVMMKCENFTPVLCRGRHFYFRVVVTNHSGGSISGPLRFVGYTGYDCDPVNTLITMQRSRTYPPGYTGSSYFFYVPCLVTPGEYSVSVGGNLSGYEFFCCMNTTIIQCEPWRASSSPEWQLAEVDAAEIPLPSVTELHQNYPNPFNAETKISYTLAEASHVSLRIYDITGRLVATLVDNREEAGEHAVTWDASDISSGVYFCKLKTNSVSCVKKMNLLK